MSRYVVDASVAIKWFLPQVYADSARSLLAGDHSLLVPDLLYTEVGSILWKEIRFGLGTAEEARRVVTVLNALPLEVYPSKAFMPLTLDIALQTQRTVYDSLYLALATTQKCRMVTADRKFYNALTSSTFATHILWVEDI